MLFLLGYNNYEIIINTKTPFHEKFSELFCIGNDFAKNFAKCRNLFIHGIMTQGITSLFLFVKFLLSI